MAHQYRLASARRPPRRRALAVAPPFPPAHHSNRRRKRFVVPRGRASPEARPPTSKPRGRTRMAAAAVSASPTGARRSTHAVSPPPPATTMPRRRPATLRLVNQVSPVARRPATTPDAPTSSPVSPNGENHTSLYCSYRKLFKNYPPVFCFEMDNRSS